MRRGVLFFTLVLSVLGIAAPAGAAQAGMWLQNDIGLNPGPYWVAGIVSGAGNDNVVISTSNAAPSVDPSTTDAEVGPTTVTITDSADTFDPGAAPSPSSEASLPCEIVDAHTARCTAPDHLFVKAYADLGDGNNTLSFDDGALPLREEFLTGSGNDSVSTGRFTGDANFRWASSTGAGNDTVHIGPIDVPVPDLDFPGSMGPGLWVDTGAGNDTVYSVDGASDVVQCGGDPGDTLYAEPWDNSYEQYGQPVQTCRHRPLT